MEDNLHLEYKGNKYIKTFGKLWGGLEARDIRVL